MYIHSTLKPLLTWLTCLVLRLLPWRAPNIEPLLAAQMPLGRRYGYLSSFWFGVASVYAYDILTGTLAPRTAFIAPLYGVIGIATTWYLRRQPVTSASFARAAVVSTLVYDAATGLTIGPIFWGQPLWAAVVGQIPFTLLHLFGNVSLALVVSPLLYRWYIQEEKTAIIATQQVI